MSFWELLKASITFWNCLTLFGGCSWCQRVSCTLPPAPPPPAPPPHPATPRRAAPARPVPPNLRKSRRLIPPVIQVLATRVLATALYSFPARASRSRVDV